MGQLVDEDEVGRPHQRGNDAEVGEIARAENATCFRILQAREPRLERGKQGWLPVTKREAPAPTP